MKNILLLICLLTSIFINAQNQEQKALSELDKYKEVVINIKISEKTQAKEFINNMSVVSKNGNSVLAYMNKKQFINFLDNKLPYTVIKRVNNKNATVVTTISEMVNWDKYPSYDLLVEMMYKFQTDYPDICKVINIGNSTDGREILAAKISDNVNDDEDEPEFLYTAQMHGNEIMTYVLMLRFIDYLLTNYNTDTQVTDLVNNIEIWINPLANPDGTYAGGNTNVSNATRLNSQSIDLNRNFTNIETGEDPSTIATETTVFKNFADSRNFVMSANLHTGYEVVNYPWDIWTTNDPYGFGYPIRPHADDNWWQYVSAVYANDAQSDGVANGLSNYLTYYESGYTEGGDWSVITGSRQDYINYYTNCRETTFELQDAYGTNGFILDATELPKYWLANKQALLDYMKEVLYGFRGIVTDEITGNAIIAKVEIAGHDTDNSYVYSALPIGDYHRPIYEGTYTVTFSATGYYSKDIEISVTNGNTTIQNVSLMPITQEISLNDKQEDITIYPNPTSGKINLNNIGEYSNIEIINTNGVVVNKTNIKNNIETLNLSTLSKGIYFLKFSGQNNIVYKKLIIK